MSYLLFMDESGHDHRTTPYEVRGGIALHDTKMWPFIRAIRSLEESCFGDFLYRYKTEIKGSRLLDKDRFRWASQDSAFDELARRKHCLAFLNKSAQRIPLGRTEFTAFGQACLAMARGTFQLLREYEAVLFASVIPCNVHKPATYEATEFLRKDHVFLLERFFYFLDLKGEQGLLIMDETDKTGDRRFVARLQRYFMQTEKGRFRAGRVIPVPFFVASDMAYPVQVADVCVYCINFGFRLPSLGMTAPTRPEIGDEFGPWLNKLQFDGYVQDATGVFRSYGIVYVPDPYESRREK